MTGINSMVRQGKQQRLRESSASLDFEPPDGGWGWLVALGAFTEMFLTMGTLLCSGVYFSPLQHEFEMSAAELGWVISSGSTLLSATCKCVIILNQFHGTLCMNC